VALGTATFGVAPLAQDVDALVGTAFDLGVNFFDTANSYGNEPHFDRSGAPPARERASAEELLGAALRRAGRPFLIATKVGEPLGQARIDGPFEGCLTRKHIREQAHASLRRLGVEHIDLYYAHQPDPRTPVAETIGAFNELIKDGAVGDWAISNFSAGQTALAVRTAQDMGLRPPVANQVSYSLANRAPEDNGLSKRAESLGVALVPYGPLGGGLLGGPAAAARDYAGHRRWGGEGFAGGELAGAQRLSELAEGWGYAPALLALAWLLGRRNVASVILGTSSSRNLATACAAAGTELTPEQISVLDGLSFAG
jgi:aryl-alcohol dehydrogenase-like predicted oxidoreductase